MGTTPKQMGAALRRPSINCSRFIPIPRTPRKKRIFHSIIKAARPPVHPFSAVRFRFSRAYAIIVHIPTERKPNTMQENYLWKDRRRIIFGLPWTFTRYRLSSEKLIIDTGFFSRKEEEIRLYRILDITLKRPLNQRLWGLGTVHLCTADKSSAEVDIKRIKKPREFKELLSDLVEKERTEKRIGAREYMSGGEGFEGEDMDLL